MKTKLFSKLLTATGLAVALALGAQPDQAHAQTTLKFVSWQVDESGVADWWRLVIKEFEATHPDVKIEFTKVARNEYADTMLTLFASGSPPEIVHLASFEYQMFADNGWLEDLGPWIEQSDLDLTGWAGQEKCIWKGTTNCIMLLYFGFVMVYNEKLLAEAGVEVPTNYEEFLAAARTLTVDKDGDGIIDQFGTGHQTTAGNQYLHEMLNYILDAGAYWTDSKGKPAMNTPEMIEGLTRWKTILTEGLTPMDVSSGETRQLFNEEKIAMRVDGPWIYGIVRGADPEVFEHIKLTAPPFKPPVGGSSNVLTMPSDLSQDKKELVWDFIEIVTSEEFQKLFAENSASPAPRPGAVTDAVYDAVPHFDLLIEVQQAAAAAGVDRIPLGLEIQFTEFGKIVVNEMQRMIIEDLDPAEVAARLQEKAEALQ